MRRWRLLFRIALLHTGNAWRTTPYVFTRRKGAQKTFGSILFPRPHIASCGHPIRCGPPLLDSSIKPELLQYGRRQIEFMAPNEDPSFYTQLVQQLEHRAVQKSSLENRNRFFHESCKELTNAFSYNEKVVGALLAGQIEVEEVLDDQESQRDVLGRSSETIYKHYVALKSKSHEHRQDLASGSVLQDYAAANLVSTEKPWRRMGIEWCHEQCYLFFAGGGAAKLRAKLARKHAPENNLSTPASYEELYPKPQDQPLQFLDIGSGGSFFKSFEELDVTALDLCPVDDSAFCCDFLKLKVGPPSSVPIINRERKVDSSSGAPIAWAGALERLPAASFDVAVMNMVLSYLQDPSQRTLMVFKARQLLKDSGLLLITLPASFFLKNPSTKHRNLLREWTHAIEAMGFKRWKYYYSNEMKAHALAFAAVGNFVDYAKRPLQPLWRLSETLLTE